MTDYARLIDTATWAFIRASEAAYPADTSGFSFAQHRATYDAMCAVFRRPLPDGISTSEVKVAGVPCRIYHGGQPTVIYYHGGGYFLGGLQSHDDVCAEICARTGLTVVSVDYRLSPEHHHPAAHDDAVAVTLEIATQGAVLLVGDSAGGNLAASVAHALRAHPVEVLGQVLIYAGLGGDPDKGSYLTHAQAPMLTTADVIASARLHHGGKLPVADPTAHPLCDTDFAGLPPTIAIAAECDPISDDSAAYAAAITADGGRAVAVTEAGLVHGYLRARHTVPRAAASFTRICDGITDLSLGRWPPRSLK
ncbi:MAG: alpha/beta hydrolase [bacterium]